MTESAFEKNMNLAQLAKHLGLSESTVSKALNGRPDVSATIRRQVQNAADELGYRPNPNARRLAMGKSRSVGVFLLNRYGRPAGEYFGFNFLGGIMHEAELLNYDVLLFSESVELKRVGYLKHALSKDVEGIICIDLDHDDPRMSELAISPLPLVSIDTPVPGSHLPMISSDNRLGIRLAVQHLVERGRQNLGYIGIHGEGYIAQQRREGFATACAEFGIKTRSSCIVETKLDVEGGYIAAKRLLSQKKPPQALVCAADLQAIGAIKAAHELGLEVPRQLAVTGFDDLPGVAHLSPALTTIAQDAEGIGRYAARLVISKTQTGTALSIPGQAKTEQSVSALETERQVLSSQDFQAVLIPPRLIVREST